MDFLDKLSQAARTAANTVADATRSAVDSAHQMLDISKLNSKINDKQKEIEQRKQDLGEYYWQQYQEGQPLSATAHTLCAQINEAYQQIEQYQEQISLLKQTHEEESPAETTADDIIDAQFQPQEPDNAHAPHYCPYCGATLIADAKYCSACGKPVH